MSAPLKISELEERSDIDSDFAISADDLGNDWGDGFFVQEEPVLIKRDSRGNIVRTIPLSEVEYLREMRINAEKIAEAGLVKEVEPVKSPGTRLNTEQRNQLVFIIAKRLCDWYMENMDDITGLNPVRDGIPTCAVHKDGCPLSGCEKIRSVRRKYASPYEVLQWLTRVVGDRAKIVNKRQDWRGYTPDISISRAVSK